MRRLATALCLAATIILSSAPVRPYTLQFTDASNSVQIRWPTHSIKIALSTSLTTPQSNIKLGSDVIGAARRALNHWRDVANIRFNVVSSEVQSISAPGTRGDGLSLITVAHTAENSAPFTGDGSEMSGRTRIFSTVGGSITEADIVLNPGQPFSTDGTPGTYDLEATFTHEIGHLLGLEHSGVLGATMQPRQAKNGIYNLPSLSARTLSDDDRAGIRAIYGMRMGASKRGVIAGTITFASGAPIFGANVWAEEETSGRVVGSNITLSNGSYRIEGILPGRYRVIVQSLGGTVFASEIASQRGAYAGLAFNQQLPFRTEEIGEVSVKPEATTSLNAQLSGSPALIIPAFVGINRELSSVAVPLVPGYTYKIFVAGEGIKATQFAGSGITTSSPFIVVDPSSLADVEFGNGLSVISFDVMVSVDVSIKELAGDYSLRFQSLTGEVAYIAGGLTIETSESIADLEQNETLVAQAALPDTGHELITAAVMAIIYAGPDETSANELKADADSVSSERTSLVETTATVKHTDFPVSSLTSSSP